MIVSYLILSCLCIVGTICEEKPPDPTDLLVVHKHQLGTTDDIIDGSAKYFWGHDAKTMITFVRIEYYEDDGIKFVRCVGFGYEDKECNCPEVPDISTHKVLDYPIEREEWITEVRGNFYIHIGSIYFKTNKGKEIGPYGTETDIDKMNFKASRDGAPLLYVEGYKGLWIYNLNFFFHDTGIMELEDIANEVANRSYTTVKGKIEEIFQIRDDYNRMIPDMARKGCYYFEDDQNNFPAKIACDLQHLLDQIGILATASQNLRNHERRNLLELKDFDSAMYMEQVKDAKQFHNLVTEIKFDLQTIIDVTDQQSSDLNRYFSSIAEIDIAIAKEDQAYIKGAINGRMEDTQNVIGVINQRFTQILGVGVSLAATVVIDKAFQLGTIIAANMNPFKWLFGGPDVDAIYEAVEELSAAVKDLIMLSTLLGRLDEFVNHSRYVVEQLMKNMEQIAAMEEIISVLANETDPNVVAEKADEYVKLYSAYTPQVKEKDLVYATTLLSAVASEACSIIGDFTGLIGDILGSTYEPATLDCQFIEADIAALESLFGEVYTLQFELIDSLTSIVKGTIAKANADRIGSISKTIDLRTAAIGTAMVETKYQAASISRCDILEYVFAGKRPDICEHLLFRDEHVEKLIAYTGSLHESIWSSYGFLPIGHDSTNITLPFINITNILRGSLQGLSLPSDKKKWMQEYGWLPYPFDEESAFYFLTMELYLPGIKCNETGATVHRVNVRSVSGNSVDLYSEDAPPKYHADKQMTVFEYYEPADGPCPGKKQTFPIYDGETHTKKDEATVCVTSPGDVVSGEPKRDFTYPSAFNTWTMNVTGRFDCTLVVDDSLDYTPMATVRLVYKQVFVKKDSTEPGMNHCWPSGSRCKPDEFCINEPLDYHCQASTKRHSPFDEYIYKGLYKS